MNDELDDLEDLEELLQLSLPLPTEIAEARANCFNAIQYYWFDTEELKFVGPEDFVAHLNRHFEQIAQSDERVSGDVWTVWSRTSDDLPVGTIRLDQLVKKEPGYPFGLVVEHALVVLDDEIAFQKRDPSKNGPYELVAQ